MLVVGLYSADGGSVIAASDIRSPTVIGPFYPAVFNGDLRDLPQTGEGDTTLDELPPPLKGEKDPPLSPMDWVDPVAQTITGAGQMPDPIMNFPGLNRNDGGGWTPPDTNGDVGPNHYIENVNIGIGIYNKFTGAELVNVEFDDFFGGTGTSCDDQNRGDPIVLYDHLADRWVITDFSLPSGGPFLECIAVSQTGDPVGGGWYFYALNAGNAQGSWHDYPKLGVWSDAYYMSANMFAPWAGAKVWALDRDAMLIGDPLTAITFDLGTSYGSLLPANLEGPLPPAGAPNYFTSIDYPDTLQLWEFHVDWAVPGNSSLTGPVELTVANYGFISGIPQPPPGQVLDSLGDRLMMQLQYRNFGDHESLWVNHSVASGGVAGVRWYEVRDPDGMPYIYQQGTYQPDDSTYRWMGSLAVDGDGNMAVGYSVSSETLNPGIRYTGRLAGEPLGILPQGETSLIEGMGVQTSSNRWGDYSAMTVDPVDDCTFWYTTEYYNVNGGTWQTRIGSFRFPSCGRPKGWIEGLVYDEQSLEGIPGVLVTAESLTTTLTVESDIIGYYTMTLPGETYTITAGPLPPTYPNPSIVGEVVVNAGETTQLDIPLIPNPALVEDYYIIGDSPPFGNGNGYPEPGESQITLVEAISNTGGITATNVTAQLMPLSPDVTVTVDTSSYPDIPPGGFETNLTDFEFSISPDVPCGEKLDFIKLISTDQGPFTITFSMYASIPIPGEPYFFDDMESGSGNWTTGGVNNLWAITPERSHSPDNAWSDSPYANYPNNVNSWVRSPVFDLSGQRDFTLSFWHQYDMESGWDFDYVEYSLDGGNIWEVPLANYTGLQVAWEQESFDIPAFDDQSNVAFRFRMETDTNTVTNGWFIDDVELSYIPYECSFPVDVPGVPVPVSPPSGTITTTHTITLSWLPGGDIIEDGYNIELDGEVYTTTMIAFPTIVDAGVHTWRVRAFNIWGNSEFSDFWNFDVIDPPGAPSLVSPMDTALVYNPVIFEWEPSMVGSTPDGYIFTLDGSPVMTFTEPVTSTTMVLTEDEHTWSVKAYNFAGDSPESETWSLSVLPDPPGVPTLLSPTDGTVSGSNQVTFTWEDSGTGGESQGYYFMLDSSTFITFTTPVTGTTISLDGGMHTWSVAAYNAGGSSAYAPDWVVEVSYLVFLPFASKD
jgi:hypothetical protein